MQTAPHFISPKIIPEEKMESKMPLLGSKALIVSIHDVSTATRSIVEKMIRDLAEAGVETTSLLIIPDHHHQGCMDADPVFSPWLQSQIQRGHEPVLHGYYHLRPQEKDENLAVRLITRSYTAGEGEFFDLSFDAASNLLRKGKAVLKKCGIESQGFIAPAWLLGKEAERAVRAEGFQYTTRIGTILDLRSRELFSARSMVYSVRSGWRRAMSLIWNEILFLGMRNSPLLRIGLHPPDWQHPAIRAHILRCINEAVALREVVTYGKWLARRANSVHEQRQP